MRKMKGNSILRLLGVTVVLSALTFAGANDGKAESETHYKAVTAILNKDLPKQIDENNRMEG
jgi:hypothetical protein